AGRRDDAPRDAVGAAAGAVRDLPSPRLLLGDGARAYRHPLGGYLRIARRCGGRARDRAPGARDAAHREPPAASRARLRAGPRPQGDHRPGRALLPRPRGRRCARAGPAGPPVSDGDHRSVRRRAGGHRGDCGDDQRRGGNARRDGRALPPEDRLRHPGGNPRPPCDARGVSASRQTAAGVGPGAGGPVRVSGVHEIGRMLGVSIVVTELGASGTDASAWRADVVRALATGPSVEIDGRRARRFRLTSERPIQMNGREYPATLEVVKNGEGLAVVNELPLEDYLVGVLRAETSERWPLEMLRAQAIVARTYAAYHRILNALKPYHIVASTVHQAYVGLVPSASPVWDGVRDTRDQVLLWERGLFPAFYHS